MFQGDMVCIKSHPNYDTTNNGGIDGCLHSLEEYDPEDDIVPKEYLQKVGISLRGKEDVALEIPRDKPKSLFCKRHKFFWKQSLQKKKETQLKQSQDVDKSHFKPLEIPLAFAGKNESLYYVDPKSSSRKK